MTQLKLAPHTSTQDTVVEIWIDGEMAGVIYPTPRGFRVISKYLTEYLTDSRGTITLHPPVLEVTLK